jgi:hypothetical protein
MYTVEHEYDATVVRTLDESGSHEDVEMILDGDLVYLRQWDVDLNKYEMVVMHYQQLLDIAVSLHTSEGLHKIEIIAND